MNFINKRGFHALILIVGILIFPPTLHAGDTVGTVIDRYIEIAYQENDELSSMEQRVKETYKKIDPAGSLDNPRLQAGFTNLPEARADFDEDPMTSKTLALMQKIPFYGKRDARTRQAIAAHRISRAHRDDLRAELAHKIRVALLNWWETTELIRLREEEAKQLNSFVEIARSRYETGKGIEADLQRAESRLTRVDDSLLTLRQRERTLRDRLRRLLGGSELLSETPPSLPQSDFSLSNLEEWTQQLEQHSSRLRADSEQIQAARSGVELARLNFYPDVDVGIQYRDRENHDDLASIALTIPLPLWTNKKESPELQSRKHRLQRYRALYRDRRDQLRFELEEAWFERKRNRSQLELYRNRLVPQTERALESTLSAYQVGSVEFVSLLETEIEWFRVKSEWVRKRVENIRLLSKITRILGFERMEELQ